MSTLNVSTGELNFSATGPISGSVINTSTLTGNYVLKLRVRNMQQGNAATIAIEDTASATPFSDARNVESFTFVGPGNPEGAMASVAWYSIPRGRVGGSNNALRLNVLSLDSGATGTVDFWISQ